MFVPKIAVRTISAESVLIFEILGGVFFGIVLLGLVHLDFHVVGTSCALVAGFCSYLGVYYYIKTVKSRSVGLCASVASLYPVVTVVLGCLILGERTSLRRTVGIILSIVAIYLMNLPETRKHNKLQKTL
jgi:drug/metabolite transporter (DMT)-like permease